MQKLQMSLMRPSARRHSIWLRKSIQTKIEIIMKAFDDMIDSRWVWGNKKNNLEYFKGLFELSSVNLEKILDLYESVQNLNKAILDLSEKIEKNQASTKEQKETLSKIRQTLDEPRIAKVAEIMERIEKKMQESSKAVRDYSV